MSYIYAELDESNICKAVSDLSGEVIADTMIPLETYDTSLLGKRYEEGEWIEVAQPESVEPEPTEDELQWRAITDLEIAQMEYYQALTDLEIEVLNNEHEKQN